MSGLFVRTVTSVLSGMTRQMILTGSSLPTITDPCDAAGRVLAAGAAPPDELHGVDPTVARLGLNPRTDR